jgi:hypothetical protein
VTAGFTTEAQRAQRGGAAIPQTRDRAGKNGKSETRNSKQTEKTEKFETAKSKTSG